MNFCRLFKISCLFGSHLLHSSIFLKPLLILQKSVQVSIRTFFSRCQPRCKCTTFKLSVLSLKLSLFLTSLCFQFPCFNVHLNTSEIYWSLLLLNVGKVLFRYKHSSTGAVNCDHLVYKLLVSLSEIFVLSNLLMLHILIVKLLVTDLPSWMIATTF
jgi:hypothetical protein